MLDFLRQLQRHIRRPIVLLWDGGPIHRRKMVQDYIARNRHRLHVYRFPAYAPELNPDEYIWTQGKACLANDAPNDQQFAIWVMAKTCRGSCNFKPARRSTAGCGERSEEGAHAVSDVDPRAQRLRVRFPPAH
jgi:hypothetical protein